MVDYDFYAGFLKYIGDITERETPEVSDMLDELLRLAAELRMTGKMTVEQEKLSIAARGMAGLAGFLQEQILPEVVASQNEKGEKQVRWVIDTSMEVMTDLMSQAELIIQNNDEAQDTAETKQPFVISLPEPPSYQRKL